MLLSGYFLFCRLFAKSILLAWFGIQPAKQSYPPAKLHMFGHGAEAAAHWLELVMIEEVSSPLP
jgi:hypothetical protein